ncbi:hypothetical protein EDD15DRAFT_794103 [Pisolithus albus]|nr:hypothetical protein EDD15DRAFT_794103 [Pisolithus albus]
MLNRRKLDHKATRRKKKPLSVLVHSLIFLMALNHFSGRTFPSFRCCVNHRGERSKYIASPFESMLNRRSSDHKVTRKKYLFQSFAAYLFSSPRMALITSGVYMRMWHKYRNPVWSP